MPVKRRPFLIRILTSKKVFFLALVSVILISYAFLKEIRRYHEVNTELEELETELKSLQSRHIELLEMVDYFRSESFVELEARDKLGYKKEGEEVTVITDLEATSTWGSLWGKEEKEVKEVSNLEKWWLYFFEPKEK